MTACARCGDPTDAIYRVCRPCVAAIVDETRTAQGLPLVPSEETMARVARLLRPATRGAA